MRECDVYLLILGNDVSDPVKAEYRTAVECNKPRLCFVQEGVERTEALKGFLPALQADVKYATFSDEESLRREGRYTACEAACPARAIHVGTTDEISAMVGKKAAERTGKEKQKLS